MSASQQLTGKDSGDHQGEAAFGDHCERLCSFPNIWITPENIPVNIFRKKVPPFLHLCCFLRRGESTGEAVRLKSICLGSSVGRMASYTHPWPYFASHFCSFATWFFVLYTLCLWVLHSPWISPFLIINSLRSYNLFRKELIYPTTLPGVFFEQSI